MKQLAQLHEEFIDAARRPMSLGKLPVNPQRAQSPIVAVERWRKEGDPKALVKTFAFRRPDDRNNFVVALMDYEFAVQHHATLTISEGRVDVSVCTKDLDQITENDKEYAKFADQVFRDLVNSPDPMGTEPM